ncbi:MAG: hypothetical protein IID46_00160 [Planctomycetes bacterium]|nr:hypothetical protein [Planctomycetota bacterium]
MGLTCLRVFYCVILVSGSFVLLSTSADAAAPVDAAVTKAHYIAEVEKELVRITASLTVRISGSEPVAIPLTFGEAVVQQPAEENVQLLGTGDGSYSLILTGEGERTVELHLTIPVHESDGDHSFELHCPPAAVNTLDLTIPKADQEIRLTPFSVPLSVEKPKDASTEQTRIKAQFGSTSTITARWFLQNRVKPKVEPLVGVTNSLQVLIDEKTRHSIASLKYRVWQGEIETLQFAVPLGDRILDVSAPEVGLMDWESVTEEKRQLVTVRLLKSLSGTIEIEVHTESAVPLESFEIAGVGEDGTVHGIHAVDVLREAGVIILSQSRTNPLPVTQQNSVMQPDENTIPELLRRPRAQYFRFFNPNMQVALSAPEAPREDDEVVISRPVIEKGLIEVELGKGSENSIARYRCRYRIKAGRQKRLAVELPYGAKHISVSINGQPADLKRDKSEKIEEENTEDDAGENVEEDDSQNQPGLHFLDISELTGHDETFLLTILFQNVIGPSPFEDRLGKLHLALPKIQFDEEERSIEQQLHVAVWVPPRFALIGQPESYLQETTYGLSDVWKPRGRSDLQSENLADWIGDRSLISAEFSPQGYVYLFRRQGETDSLEVTWCDMPFAGWTLSLSLFLIAWVLGRTSWKNKLSVLLVAGFATAMIALEKPDWVYHGWSAARYGVIAMLGLWLIQSLPGVNSKRSRKTSHPSSSTPPPQTSAPVVVPPSGALEALKADLNRGKSSSTK